MPKDSIPIDRDIGIGKIILDPNFEEERKEIISQLERIQLFNEKIEFLEKNIETLINDHEDIKESIRQQLFWHYYPELFFIVSDNNKTRINKSLLRKYETEYAKINSRIKKAGGFFKDYKSKRTKMDYKITPDRILPSGFNLINELMDKIDEFENYNKAKENRGYALKKEFPEDMIMKLKVLEEQNIINSYKSKPNFKHLRHAIVFFDLCNEKYDIPDYGMFGKKDGKKNKIISDSIFINKKKPSENNISKTRKRITNNNKYFHDITTLFPDLFIK